MNEPINDVTVALFAGGSGRRLWPISRASYPKQFVPLINNQSTLQLAYQRLQNLIPNNRIFLTTNQSYAELVQQQLPDLPDHQIIYEPERRDVAAAVALSIFTLYHRDGLRGPLLIQWTDNHIEQKAVFHDLLMRAFDFIHENNQQFIFLGQTPRYPNDNLGWIHLSEPSDTDDNITTHGYLSSEYRPTYEDCIRYMQNGKTVWNTGYFVTSIEFMISKFHEFAPEIASTIETIVVAKSPQLIQPQLETLYPQIAEMTFDHAFTDHLHTEDCLVLKADFEWSDPGTLYSLKELYPTNSRDVVQVGNVISRNAEDMFVYNAANDKTIVADHIKDLIVVNMHDVLLIIPKHAVRNMSGLIDYLRANGHEAIL